MGPDEKIRGTARDDPARDEAQGGEESVDAGRTVRRSSEESA